MNPIAFMFQMIAEKTGRDARVGIVATREWLERKGIVDEPDVAPFDDHVRIVYLRGLDAVIVIEPGALTRQGPNVLVCSGFTDADWAEQGKSLRFRIAAGILTKEPGAPAFGIVHVSEEELG